jgi:glucose-1-phosphate cytidylyltransferase
MKLVILAGGLGTRISEETDYIPKPMVLIGQKPILWHIIKYYSVFGFTDFIICGGYKINIIKNFFRRRTGRGLRQNTNKLESSWKVKVIYTGKDSNTGERLKRVKKFVGSTFCLTYGDGLSNINLHKLISFHKKNKATVTLTAVKPESRFGKIFFKGNKVSKFIEKDRIKENWINGGFFVCEKEIFKFLNKKNSILESDTLSFLAKKNKLAAYKHKYFWYCMDTLRDKRYLNNIWFSRKAPWKLWDE